MHKTICYLQLVLIMFYKLGKTKNEIFTLISKWVALNYNAINVVQEDNEGGLLSRELIQ